MFLKEVSEGFIALQDLRPLRTIRILLHDLKVDAVVVVRGDGYIKVVQHAYDLGLLLLHL